MCQSFPYNFYLITHFPHSLEVINFWLTIPVFLFAKISRKKIEIEVSMVPAQG